MKQMQQEEIFAWFQSLSGAKRIELMCGLISMCIPLEVRFFETIIQDVVKKDAYSFQEAEVKANSFQELDIVCKSDLLLEKINTGDHYYEEPTEMNGNGSIMNTNNTAPASNNNNNVNSTTNTNSNDVQVTNNSPNNNNTNKVELSTSTSTTNTISNIITIFPSRSKLIISLCLMQPSNTPCSSLVFNSIRKQLMPDNVYNAVCHVYLPKNHNIEQLFSELLLLLTMAMYHPAFTYEQRDLLASQKKEIEQLYYEIISYIRSQHLIAAAQVQVPIAASAAVASQVAQTTGPAAQTSTTSGAGVVAAASVITSSTSGQQQTSISNQSIYHQTTNPPGQQTQPTPQPQSVQSHHNQTPHQYHHTYHQSSTNKSHHQNAGPHLGPPSVPTQSFTVPFIPSPMPMANITYTSPQGPVNINNQTSTVIQNMALLKLNSPQQSSSPSPSISPSSGASNKISIPTSTAASNLGQFAIKLDPMYTTGGLSPHNSLITIVDTNSAVPSGTICIHTPLVVDDGKSMSSTVSSASCYNCGNRGHRGTECTSVGTSSEDNH